MKTPRLIFGLLLAAWAPLLAGAPPTEVQLNSPPKKDSPSLSDKAKSPPPPGPQIDYYGPGSLEDTVLIMGVTEQKPDAKGSRKVTVRVQYALVHYSKGVLSLGFNLKSATKFTSVTDQPVLAGSEEVELSATIVPVVWPKAQPFKVTVSLSAEPHPGQWSLLAASSQAMKPTAKPMASAPESAPAQGSATK